MSEEGRRYRNVIATLTLRHRVAHGQRLAVRVDAHPPDRRRRDLDNLSKALLDALQHAGVIEDDACIDDLRLVRRDVVRGGRVVVTIHALP